MSARIINADYAYIISASGGIGMAHIGEHSAKPWHAVANGKVRRFRTHARAIRWATKQVRKGKK